MNKQGEVEDKIFTTDSKTISDGAFHRFDQHALRAADVIDLSNKKYLTFKMAIHLRDFSINAHTIDISGSKIRCQGAMALASIATLRNLNLNHCGIENKGAIALFKHPSLHRLQLKGNLIGFEALLFLKDNNALRYLAIECSDFHLQYLAKCSIRELDLNLRSNPDKTLLEKTLASVHTNRQRCDQYLRVVTTTIMCAKLKSSNLSRLPNDVLLRVLFLIGIDLPKIPIQIASCATLLLHRVIEKNPTAVLNQPQKSQALAISRYFFPKTAGHEPAQYCDEQSLKLFLSM